jgi:5-methylcytosine-specific restriction endonuclease McrA
MRRLIRPAARYRRDLAGVLDPRERVQLAMEVNVACDQARRYRRRTPRLAGLTSGVTSPVARECFLALYGSQKKAVVSLKARVWAMLDDTTRAFCQYCGIGEPRTLDHFVEKAVVPELALYLPNLVPCCHPCNNGRRETFTANGTRRVLHFYDDDIDRLPELLRADIDWPPATGVPAASYTVQPSHHALAIVYATHFGTLKLAERYRTAAALELRRLRCKLGGRTTAQVTAELHSELRGTAVYGTNDYRAALYRAIIATPAALAWVMQP